MPKLRAWLDMMLWERDGERDDIYRMKGVIHVAGSSRLHVLQVVYELYDVLEGPAVAEDVGVEGGGMLNRLVVTGANLSRERLVAGFCSCLVEPPALV